MEVAVKLVVRVSETRNVQVLGQKECELAKVKKEVEALRIVATLLRDEEDWVRETAKPTLTVTGQSLIEAEAVTRLGSINASFELDSQVAVFLQSLVDDPLQFGRYVGIQPHHGHRGTVHDGFANDR